MSKSKGNYFTLRDLLKKGFDPLDIRYSILSAHYGSIYNFTFDGVKAAGKARQRLQDFIHIIFDDKIKGDVKGDADKLKKEVYNNLSNDLHTPKALAEIFTFINNNDARQFDEKTKEKLKIFFTDMNSIFEVWKLEPKAEEFIPEDVIRMAELRIQAKIDKQYATADLLRQKIGDEGYEIKDTKEGYTIVKKQ